MAISRRFSQALAAGLLGIALTACSSTPATPSTGSSAGAVGPGGSSGTGGTAAAPSLAASSQGVTGGGGGQPADICTLFSAAEIGTALGKPVQQGGPVAGEAHSCSWATDDLTNLYLYWTDPAECDDTKASLASAGAVAGADFAGANAALGATFAGVTSGGTCYVVEVAPTERSPKGEVLGQLLGDFVTRANG